VRLPSSKVAVERASILRHLLNEPTDPFTRTPLSAEQLEADAELRARAERWRETARSR
jgi:ubiquitin conjugation factor E4 B